MDSRDLFDPELTVCVWRYQDAPVGLWPANGSADDADWLMLIPPRLVHQLRDNMPWLNMGCERTEEWTLGNGAIVRVGYRT
jgi:hypothetical protein